LAEPGISATGPVPPAALFDGSSGGRRNSSKIATGLAALRAQEHSWDTIEIQATRSVASAAPRSGHSLAPGNDSDDCKVVVGVSTVGAAQPQQHRVVP
jgi:hypothetical protein